MKRLSRTLPFIVAAIVAAATLYAQAQDGTLSGRVLDRDGKTPVQGATIWIDSLVTQNGRVQIRERLEAKTGRDGRFFKSGLYIGRVKATVVIDNQPLMVRGEAVGDEIYLATGSEGSANFDLSKAPAAPPVVAGAAAPAAAGNEKDRDALRAKLEKEAAASGLMNKAFEEGKAAFLAKDYPTAIQSFKSALDQMLMPPPPGVPDVIWANLAKAYDANKQYPDAINAYKKAIEYKPIESNYYVNLSLSQISAGQITESQASIQKAAELNPANAGMAYYNLAATLINRNQPAEAVTHFKKAIELDPLYANAYYQLGLTLIGLNQMGDEAMGYLTKYIQLVPSGGDSETAKLLIEEIKKAGAAAAAPKAEPDSKAKTKQPTAKTKN